MAATLTINGRANLVQRILGVTATTPSYIAWGNDSGTSSYTNQALFGEVVQDGRAMGVASAITTSTNGDTLQVIGTITATKDETITNCGLYDVSTPASSFALQTAVTASTQNTINVISVYGSIPNSYPFNIQIASEVMTVTGATPGTNYITWNVTRGINDSTALPSIPATTPITTVQGNLFGLADFTSLELNQGDSVTLTFEVQIS